MQRTGKADTTLCRAFCTYYKPGRNEDLACEGFLVVRRLEAAGRRLSCDRPELLARPGREEQDGLRAAVCGPCSFRAADCDFAANAGAAEPCGGFVLLAHLVGARELSLDDIRRTGRR